MLCNGSARRLLNALGGGVFSPMPVRYSQLPTALCDTANQGETSSSSFLSFMGYILSQFRALVKDFRSYSAQEFLFFGKKRGIALFFPVFSEDLDIARVKIYN